MNKKEFKQIFDDNDMDGEFLEFERIKQPYSKLRDVHAFILIEVIMPRLRGDMITASEHDQIYLAPAGDKLIKKMTREQAIDLRRCGVFYDEETDSFCMFT